MGELKVRNIDSSIISKIDYIAKKKGLSREEYLRRILQHVASLPEVNEVEDKYINLINSLMERLEQNNEILEVNNMLLEQWVRKYNLKD